MYLRRIYIENIRSISELTWEVLAGKEAGWHVVIGDNGSGKSTFLRSVSLALVGESEAAALRQEWGEWLRKGQDYGRIELSLTYDARFDKFVERGKRAVKTLLPVGLEFLRFSKEDVLLDRLAEQGKLDPGRHVWSGEPGWFSAAYGPFRRFAGGEQDYEKIFDSNPILAAHLSIFGENVALTEALVWLLQLQFKKLEKRKEGNLLRHIIEFVNQDGFLPHRTRLHKISSGGVTFTDGNNCKVNVDDLSDGYRSVLSMTFELIRQMTYSYSPSQIFDRRRPGKIVAPGVVLIDEVDAHLHPTWQRRIGLWFREHFPNIQFIVTTHSPLICQAAEVGTVWRLPKPGSREEAMMVTGTELDRLLYGNVLDAYGTELFGKDVARSETSKAMMERLADLNVKEMDKGLTKKEKMEQARLRAAMPTAAHRVSRRGQRAR